MKDAHRTQSSIETPGNEWAAKERNRALLSRGSLSKERWIHSRYEDFSAMTGFDDREKAFETKFAKDQELAFRVTARRNRLLGEWAAELMGLTREETDAYAKAVVQADFEEAGDEDVVRKLLGDLVSAGVDMDESRIRTALSDKMAEARRQFMQEG
jgi:hypothetical protein